METNLSYSCFNNDEVVVILYNNDMRICASAVALCSTAGINKFMIPWLNSWLLNIMKRLETFAWVQQKQFIWLLHLFRGKND